MSAPNRISSRTRWAGVIGCGREPQMIPWWQSTIWAPARGRVREQLAVGGHAGDHLAHLARAGHLEAVGAVVLERLGESSSSSRKRDELVAVCHRATQGTPRG